VGAAHGWSPIHHLFKAKERVAATLASIHNERFTVRLVDRAREAMESSIGRKSRLKRAAGRLNRPLGW
jgi:tRNA-guanine family transglycosylase